MPDLCTLAEVKAAQPVIDHDDDDTILGLVVTAASEAVIAYLDARAALVIGLTAGGDLQSGAEVPKAVTVATILTARHLYEGKDELQARPGGIPYRAEMLLYRLADPSVA